MDWEQLYRNLRGDDKDLLSKLDDLKKALGLDKLYLIHFAEREPVEGYLDDPIAEVAWGIRSIGAVDKEIVSRRVAEFLKDHAGWDCPIERIKVLDRAVDEVDYLFSQGLQQYVASHGGELTLESVDESCGLVEVSLSGSCGNCHFNAATMQFGIKNLLVQYLPWVREVRSVGEIVDPDFGIKEALNQVKEEENRERDGWENEGGAPR